MSNDVIYTVETGEYSDHTIHAFCTSLDEAKRKCAEVVELYKREMCFDDDEEDEPVTPDSYGWPRLFENRVNVIVSHYAENMRASVRQLKWCAADPVAEVPQ